MSSVFNVLAGKWRSNKVPKELRLLKDKQCVITVQIILQPDKDALFQASQMIRDLCRIKEYLRRITLQHCNAENKNLHK